MFVDNRCCNSDVLYLSITQLSNGDNVRLQLHKVTQNKYTTHPSKRI